MPKSGYLSQNDGVFGAQLDTSKNNIGTYAATFGLSAGTVNAQAGEADQLGSASEFRSPVVG